VQQQAEYFEKLNSFSSALSGSREWQYIPILLG
jgi:hypothetical protein